MESSCLWKASTPIAWQLHFSHISGNLATCSWHAKFRGTSQAEDGADKTKYTGKDLDSSPPPLPLWTDGQQHAPVRAQQLNTNSLIDQQPPY
eukprot:1154416-Pelagomonas_calceolata.AAC.1